MRNRIGKELEQSLTIGSIVVTDENNEARYLPPSGNGDVLTIENEQPKWVTPMISTAPQPTVQLFAGAGNGATYVLEGTNECGTITINTGSGCIMGLIFEITLGGGFVFPTTCVTLVWPGGGYYTASLPFQPGIINRPMKWGLQTEAAALSDFTPYSWCYHVKGY